MNRECKPDCKASKNELCQRINGIMRCVCRSGFIRLFPDRPCKPTYTYTLSLPLYRIGKEMIKFNESLLDQSSFQYNKLTEITHEALDRMVMQSDFRDVYHGIRVTAFQLPNNKDGVISHFNLQLTDNSDESRLVDVFKKYLRGNNFSIGGTELYSTRSGVEELKVSDFNECTNPHYSDCSINANCFNLHGTYTCSCREGYADLSENPIYPGRLCSAELIGCDHCNYHGTCYTPDESAQPFCECFRWYAGATCQLNLKIFLIAIISIATITLILLILCVFLTYSKRRKERNMQNIMAGINILPPKNCRTISRMKNLDMRAMIKDSSSETSNSSDHLIHFPKLKKSSSRKQAGNYQCQKIDRTNYYNVKCHQQQQQQQHQFNQKQRKQQLHSISTIEIVRNRSTIDNNDVSINDDYHNIHLKGHSTTVLQSQSPNNNDLHRACNAIDQNDRSLTVMIPRAKYHPSLHQVTTTTSDTENFGNTLESKILAYLDAGAQVSNPSKKSSNSSKHGASHTTSTGALVSAGFEVSATVGANLLNNVIGQQRNDKTNLMETTTAINKNNQYRKLSQNNIHHHHHHHRSYNHNNNNNNNSNNNCNSVNNKITQNHNEIVDENFIDSNLYNINTNEMIIEATTGFTTTPGEIVNTETTVKRHSQQQNDNNSEYFCKKNEGHENFLDSMDDWLDTIRQNDVGESEARSYDETTIQPQTKSFRSTFDKQSTQNPNDVNSSYYEANTMAERDIGSTFLLPHTHLYKPDKGSDISGFDSF